MTAATLTPIRVYWSVVAIAFVALLVARGNAPMTWLDLIASFAIIGGAILIQRRFPHWRP